MSKKHSHLFDDFYAKQNEFNSAKKKSFLLAQAVADEFANVIDDAKVELYHFASDLYENGYFGVDDELAKQELNDYEADIVKAEKELNKFLAYANR